MLRTLFTRDEVREILGLVPADDWTFTAYRAGAPRRRGSDDARVAPISEKLAPYAAGVELIFADRRSEFGRLRLFRASGKAPFSGAEMHVLRIAVDAISRRISRLRLFEDAVDERREPPRWALARSSETVLYVLDREFAVVLSPEGNGAPVVVERRLPAFVERAVRELVAGPVGAHGVRVAQPASFLKVRVEPLRGLGAGALAVHVEDAGERDALTRAACAFGITPREAQTLALVMDGLSVVEISQRLSVAPSTIRDHIKNLLAKTGTFNRAAMVARILGWEAGTTAESAP